MPGSSLADIRHTFGAAFIGLFVSATLFGLTIVQTWIYFWNYRKRDPKSLLFFIAFITVMDTLHTILCAYSLYWYLILNFGNVKNLNYVVWSLEFQLVISVIIGASVRFYYARRVYLLGQSIICPIVIVALVVLDCALGFLFTAEEIIVKRFSRFHALIWITSVGMTSGALSDLVIATAMCWFLYRMRTGYARTDTIITTLMAYSINSGLLTSFLAVGMLISFVISPSSLVCIAFYWTMSKCYVNSLLDMLNSRDYVRDRSTTSNSYNLSSIRIESSSNESKSGQAGVSVTAPRSTILNLSRNKSHHDVEPAFEVPKPDVSTTLSQSEGQTSVSEHVEC